MKKIRRFLTALMVINFFIGMEQGMKPGHLVMVLVNSLLIIALAVREIKQLKKDSKDHEDKKHGN